MKETNYLKEYRLRSYWVIYFLWLALCIAVGWSFYKLWNLLIQNPELWFISFSIPIEIYCLIYSWHLFQDFRLYLSENGIKLILWSRSIYVDWTQINRVSYAFFQKQLVLENPTIVKHKAWWLLFDLHKWRRDDSFHVIPFSRQTWENFDDLESEVSKRASHIFE